MSQQTDTAVPTKIQSLNQSMDGRKLRLAGRLLSYDIATALILLLDQDHAILVDVSLCVDPSFSSWLREHLSVLMIIGHVELSSIQLPIPTMPAYAAAPVIDPKLVFRAIRVVQWNDLDLDLWNSVIDEEASLDKRLYYSRN